jgi:hypothetical protein
VLLWAQKHAGLIPTAVLPESPYHLAALEKRRMDFCATLIAEMATMELDPFVGKTAHQDSEMMELTVANQDLTEEVSEKQRESVAVDAKRRVSCTTKNAEKDTIASGAAFAHLTVSTE